MKHDYRKKTNWKVDDQFETWAASKKGQLPTKPKSNSRLLIVLSIVVLIFVLGYAWHSHRNQAPAEPASTQQTINIPLSLPNTSNS
jgi:hypothetical protein